MPDLITHIIVGLILAKLLRVKKKSLVLLGAILPDMIYKLSLLGLFFDIPENVFIFGLLPLHSPIGLIITTILISFIFKYPKHKTISSISLGWISHLLLDLTNKHYLIKQTYMFMPLSYKALELGWFWQDQYYFMLLASLAILIIIYIFENIRAKNSV
ncbi:MAG: hypothetical protein KAK00_05155 [Nanoarchaeota archaeon]|nr:hypothetical protein [Nanoarchaeota archaeon]